jgi:Zn-dependent M28 family amino/carboxypeptidase
MEWIGETYTSRVGFEHLLALSALSPRLAGTDGERRAAETTRAALSEYADEARCEPFEIQGWERGDSRLRAGETQRDCIALPRSPSASATGRLVDCGYGLPRDFEGRDLEGAVVMVASNVPDWHDRIVHRREKYYRAVEAGAAGFVFRHHEPGCLAVTGSVGREGQPVGEIPAVGVSYEVGQRLARNHEGESVTVGVDAETGPAESQNVRAELGPDTDERVLVTCHVDAHDISEGALDNAAGTATMLEVARALSMRADELERTVEFVAFGAEEVGLQGSERYVREQVEDGAGTVRAVVNLDGVARSRTVTVGTQGFDALETAAEAAADRLDYPVETDPRIGPHSDHWPFVKRGVPACHVFAERLDRGWGHTAADTADKLDVRDLREAAVFLTEFVVGVAADRTSPEPKSAETLEAELETWGLAEGLRVTGDFPTGDF